MPPPRLAPVLCRRLVYTFAALAAVLWLLGAVPLLAGHTTPLFPNGPDFEDILVYKGRFSLFHTAAFFTSRRFSGFAYPAGCAVLYAALFSTTNAVTTYLYCALAGGFAALTTALIYLRKAALTSLLLPLLVLCFPFVFLIQRANVELFLFALVACAILAYRRGWLYLAAVLIGLAAACKLYPIFLLGLFLKRRRDIPAFAIGGLTFVIALCAAIAFAGPTFSVAAHGFFTGVSHFQDHYVETVRSAEIDYDHCLFSPLKYWSARTHAPLNTWLRPYYLAAGTLAAALFLRVRTMPFLNRIVFLATAMVALPPVSYTYTLTHLYLPTLLLLTTDASSTTRTTLACLLFLFLPLVALAVLASMPIGAVQSLAVLSLLFLPALKPWPTPRLSVD